MEKIILAVLALAIFSTTSHAEEPRYQGVDYTIPISGWTEEELKYSTLECVSKRLGIVRTEIASIMLENICYNQVIQDGLDT